MYSTPPSFQSPASKDLPADRPWLGPDYRSKPELPESRISMKKSVSAVSYTRAQTMPAPGRCIEAPV
jgi:hypothetical protein